MKYILVHDNEILEIVGEIVDKIVWESSDTFENTEDKSIYLS